MSFSVKSILKKTAACVLPALLLSTYAAPVTFAAKLATPTFVNENAKAYEPTEVVNIGDEDLVLTNAGFTVEGGQASVKVFIDKAAEADATAGDGVSIANKETDGNVVTLKNSYLKTLPEQKNTIVTVKAYNSPLTEGNDDTESEPLKIAEFTAYREKATTNDNTNANTSSDFTPAENLEFKRYISDKSDDVTVGVLGTVASTVTGLDEPVEGLSIADGSLKVDISKATIGSHSVTFKINKKEYTVTYKVTSDYRSNVEAKGENGQSAMLTIMNPSIAGTKLVLEKKENANNSNIPTDAIWSYDIKLTNDNGEEVSLGNNNAVLNIMLGAEYKGQKVKLYHIVNGTPQVVYTDDGKDTFTVLEDGSIGATVNSLSPFYVTLVSETTNANSTTANNVTANNAAANSTTASGSTSATASKVSSASSRSKKTGDTAFALQSLVAMVSTGLGLFVVKRKFSK